MYFIVGGGGNGTKSFLGQPFFSGCIGAVTINAIIALSAYLHTKYFIMIKQRFRIK